MIDEAAVWRLFGEKTRRAVQTFETAIARNPRDAEAHLSMGLWWYWNGAYAGASERFDSAVRLDPKFSRALCWRAALRGTCPDPIYRDGKGAVSDASGAIALARAGRELSTNWKHRVYLETLAAALAERGDFEAAVEVERQALPYCITRINEERAWTRIVQFQRGERLRVGTDPMRSGVTGRSSPPAG